MAGVIHIVRRSLTAPSGWEIRALDTVTATTVGVADIPEDVEWNYTISYGPEGKIYFVPEPGPSEGGIDNGLRDCLWISVDPDLTTWTPGPTIPAGVDLGNFSQSTFAGRGLWFIGEGATYHDVVFRVYPEITNAAYYEEFGYSMGEREYWDPPGMVSTNDYIYTTDSLFVRRLAIPTRTSRGLGNSPFTYPAFSANLNDKRMYAIAYRESDGLPYVTWDMSYSPGEDAGGVGFPDFSRYGETNFGIARMVGGSFEIIHEEFWTRTSSTTFIGSQATYQGGNIIEPYFFFPNYSEVQSGGGFWAPGYPYSHGSRYAIARYNLETGVYDSEWYGASNTPSDWMYVVNQGGGTVDQMTLRGNVDSSRRWFNQARTS